MSMDLQAQANRKKAEEHGRESEQEERQSKGMEEKLIGKVQTEGKREFDGIATP